MAKYSPTRIQLTDSGTSSLQMAIRSALAVRPGPIALPAYSCFDVSTAAEGAHARVLLYDVDPTTLSPDPASLEDAIRMGATAVVIVHLYGVPVDIDMVGSVLGRHDTILIEDAAQGAGASFADTPVGSFGDLSVLSFARGKGITGGGGGALMTRNPEAAIALDSVFDLPRRTAGWKQLVRAAGVWLLARPYLYGFVASVPFLRLGETVYRQPTPSDGITRASLGILRETFELSERESETRRHNAAELAAALSTGPGGLMAIQAPTRSAPGHLRLPVLMTVPFGKSEWASAERLGVARGYPRPLSRLESCRSICDNADDSFPGAELLAAQLITLPTHSRLTPADKSALRDWITDLS
ncbi:MAG: DegT/DnrJ/EryC1/StrS family aminotransferase [Gemmatimonadales bacterium]